MNVQWIPNRTPHLQVREKPWVASMRFSSSSHSWNKEERQRGPDQAHKKSIYQPTEGDYGKDRRCKLSQVSGPRMIFPMLYISSGFYFLFRKKEMLPSNDKEALEINRRSPNMPNTNRIVRESKIRPKALSHKRMVHNNVFKYILVDYKSRLTG